MMPITRLTHLACCSVLALLAARAAAQDRPNLLVILTDEHSFRSLGCYGGTVVGTPNIDRIAREGAICTSFYATTPVCSPSRAAFVSGRYPQNTKVVINDIPLDDETVTFAEILRRRGYATGYAGKWHLDGTGKPQWAPKRTFGFQDNRFMFNRGHWKKLVDTLEGPAVAPHNKKGKPSYAVAGADEKSFTTDWLTTKAVSFIEAHKKEPWCYMLSIPDPHGPNTVRRPYDTMFAEVEVPIPATLAKTEDQTPGWAPKAKGVTPRQIRRLMPLYYGMVKCIDDNVGRILKTLERLDLLDQTIVVFTADHGDLCGEHGRHDKGVPYEASARVPFLLRHPARVKAGTVVNETLSSVDFLPTVLALMGVPTAGEEEGRNASHLFLGTEVPEWKDIAFLRGTRRTKWLCAVTDRYKIVYSPKDVPWLFDLQEDPDELMNFFGDEAHRTVARELTRLLRDYCDKHGDPYGAIPRIRAEMAAAAE